MMDGWYSRQSLYCTVALNTFFWCQSNVFGSDNVISCWGLSRIKAGISGSHRSLGSSLFFGTQGEVRLVGCFKLITDFPVIDCSIALVPNASTWATLSSYQGIVPPGQSDRELKGQWIQNGTRHAQSLISPIWEMMAFKKSGQLALKCQLKCETLRFGVLRNLSQTSPFLESLHRKDWLLLPSIYTSFPL